MTALPVHPAAALFPTLVGPELDALAADIRAHGLLEAVVLYQGQVLDGRNRMAACELAGVAVRTDDRTAGVDNPWEYVWSRNGTRRDLPAGTKAAIRLKLLELSGAWVTQREEAQRQANAARAAAVQRQPRIDGGRFGGVDRVVGTGAHDPVQAPPSPLKVPTQPASTAPMPGPGRPAARRSLDVAAGGAGVSSRTMREADELRRKDPMKFEQVASGAALLKDALRQVRTERARAEAAQVAARAAPAVPGINLRLCDAMALAKETRGAALVHADPPWPYRVQGLNGTTGNHYAPATLLDIALTLDAAFDAAVPDAYLLLWATFPTLSEWFEASRALRWRYVSGGCWGKTGRPGIGLHWRGDVELLLLYVKGKPRPVDDAVFSNLHTAEREAHSEKPEAWLRDCLAHFAHPGLVLDLWAGMAPMARACKTLGRSYVGAELDQVRHAAALARLRA